MSTSNKEGKLLNRIAELEKELATANKKIEALDINEGLTAELTEADQIKQKALFEAIINCIPDAIVYTNVNREIIGINHSFTSIFGFTLDDLAGKKTSYFYESHEEFEKQGMIRFNLDAEELALPYEVKYRKKDGSIFPGETLGSKILDLNSKPIGFFGVIRDITERKQTEENLKESEDRLAKTLMAANDGMWDWDLKTNKVFFDARYYQMAGYDVDEFPHRLEEFQKRIHPEDLDFVLAQAQKHLNAEIDRFIVEFRFKKKQGDWLWVRGRGMIVERDKNNTPLRFIGTHTDITERKQAEDALKESEERFSRLSNLTYEGILIHDKGNILDVNSAFEKITGYSRSEIIGENIIPLMIIPKYHQAIFEAMKNNVTVPYEIEGKRKDGKVIQIELESRNIDYGDKKGVRVTAVRDISQRKRNELEILKLSNAIEQTPVSIVITNVDGGIEYVNPKFTEVTGYTAEEASNQNPRVLKTGEHSEDYYKNLWETISSGNIWSGEFHNKKKNGELFWESAIISPVKDDVGKITNYIAVKEDITEKKKMIEDLVISKEKAENADKMKSIFLAQMSHEIRTPINALVSMSSLLRYDFEEGADEDQKMSFEIIDRAGKRIIRTVDLLINLSEIQAGTYEVSLSQFDINSDIISIIMAEYKKIAAKKNIKLSLESNIINTELVADTYTVEQIFTQLIDNAIKYTEEGEIIIKTARNESDQLVVEVKDTGIGIEDEYLPHVFEPFTQEEMGYTRKFEGNGIGMALVHKYCKLNNAKIEVESKKGVGTTFRVIFEN